jgi:UDPglucose 6-dehydrogenase
MKISIIGIGYVGLVSGACFASLGHDVICVDVDKKKIDAINQGISPLYEKGLQELLQRYKNNIRAMVSYEQAINESTITFICVGTPSNKDGGIDLSFIDQAVKAVATEIQKKEMFHSVVIKSTVVPGTTRDHVFPLLEQYSGKKIGTGVGLGMNPEFLREGEAIMDFMHPYRVVNGYYDEKTRQVLHELYRDFTCPVIETSLTVAEMIKYASNCFLATKISFINEIGNMCKRLGVDVYEVADGMGFDRRIERSFLNAGIGWGGSCFPKDTRALRSWAEHEQIGCRIINSVIETNDFQPSQLINILKKHIPQLKGRTIGVLGLAFKPNTDDIRESRSRFVIESLLKEGAKIKAFDPESMEPFKAVIPNITYCSSASEVLASDAVILATVWDEFKELDYSGKIVIDGRRMLEAKKTADIYEGVCW